MSRPVILLDVDGPLTMSFFDVACREMRREGVVGAKPSALTQWGFLEALAPVTERRIRERLRRPGVASLFEPNDGARTFLSDLREWAEVYAVTAPLDGSPTWPYDREQWLIEQLDFDARHVMAVRDKQRVSGHAFVDDKLAHLIEWQAAYPSGLAIMWTCPHNKDDAWTGPRAANYDQLERYLYALKV